MSTIKNLHQVGAVLFFILAFTYMFLVLLVRGDYYLSEAIFLMRILDIPFALFSLVYGGSSLYLQVNEGRKNESILGILVFAVCILLFSMVVFMNFAFPSQI